ncbi:MAG: hypothetical protein E7647_01650 [Ruminococcaceae bacterium]|nr:hypothetical protein [Oscillospiraceae bacterium]
MTDKQAFVLWLMTAISVLLVAVPLIALIIGRIVTAIKKSQSKQSAQFARMLLAFSVMLFGAIFFVRLSSDIFQHVSAGNGLRAYDWLENILDSVIRSLQTFSLDEDYADCVIESRKMMAALAGEGAFAVFLYGAYSSLLNVLAPVAGGAIIFDILSSIFPMFRLFLAHLAFWRPKYYFNELNDRSLAFAGSILETEKTFFRRPVIIISEAYPDNDNETCQERLYKAKLLGAICLPDDIINIPKNVFGMRKYILIAENEVENLHSITGLASERKYKCLKGAEVFLFTQDDMYMLVEEQVRSFLRDRIPEKEFPVVVPVQRYRNLATNLFDDLPLYEPIIDKEKDENGIRDLNVTILGAGSIGMEMLLAAYWCGQMLDVRLNLSMVSGMKREEFFGNVDHINPDLKKSTVKQSSLLRYNKRGDCAPPYCSINYFSADIDSDHMSCVLSNKTENGKTLYDTDYFIVCLGTDEKNIAVANRLSQEMGIYHLTDEKDPRTVIAYVVFNSELCNMLNVTKKHDYSICDGSDVYMYAFGSLDEVYSTRNIYMKELELGADKTEVVYDSVNYKKAMSDIHNNRAKDNYAYWSHLARSRHVKYKIFSSGLYKKSVFNTEGMTDKEYIKDRVEAREKYKKLIYGRDHDLSLMHRLAWLEHRRWCAFLRTRGFRGTEEYVKYYEKHSSHKNMPLKLHPCLVETDTDYMRAEFDEDGIIKKELLFETDTADESVDLLDTVSLNVRGFKPGQRDFKYYDYPIGDFKELLKKE